MTDNPEGSHRTTAFRGAILTVGMRWTDRLLGFFSTLILARLLVPEDFGLVAMATVVAGFLEVLLDLGVGAALIQNTRATPEDFSTAWTLRLAQSAVAAILISIAAPLLGDFYGDPRVVPILYVIAVTTLIGGLENIGVVSFQKNMEFGRDFQFFFLRKVIGVTFVIAAAFTLRTYWALVLGSLISRTAGVGISYWMSEFRPRISVVRLSQIWSFSQWNMLVSTGQYLLSGTCRLLVGRRSSAHELGAYSMGEEIALMPTTELLAPLGRVMLPVFAAAKHDGKELLRLVALALGIQSLVAFPAGVGIALVATDAVAVMLGEKWSSTVPFVQIIALASVTSALAHSVVYMLLALGQIRTLAAYSWLKVAMLVALVLMIFPTAGAHGIAFAFLAVSFAGFVVSQVMAKRAVPGFRYSDVMRMTWRPLASTALMAGVVQIALASIDTQDASTRLLVGVLVGATTYVLAILATWRFSGSPIGAETYLLEKTGVSRYLRLRQERS